MKPFWQRVNERAASVASANKINNAKKARYKKRVRNRQRLYKIRKALGRV